VDVILQSYLLPKGLAMGYVNHHRQTEVLRLSPPTLEAAFDHVADYWSPKVIGQANNQLLKAAKLKGEQVRQPPLQ
jgi:hypothetical protein